MVHKMTCRVFEFDAATAKKLLGFRTELREGETGYRFVDGDNVRKKFVLDNNRDNRPFNLGLAETYGETMFRGEWAGQWNSSSETGSPADWSVDSNGQIVSMAHRGVGLILAQAKRDRLKRLGQDDLLEELSVPETITVQGILVEGVDPAAADMVDTGRPRKLADVLFRRHELKNGKEISESVKVRLTRELSTALRLVWLRMRGERVSGGGKFTFPEALKFLEAHPLLADCLLHVYHEDGAVEGVKSPISSYISLGYAAGLMYLQAFSSCDRKDYEDGSLVMSKNPKYMKAAEEFWTLFSQLVKRGVSSDKAPAIAALANVLDKNNKSEAKFSRDALCVLVTRAWVGWMGTDEKFKYETAAKLTKGLFKREGDAEILDFIRFGGLDVDYDVLLENGWVTVEPDNFEMKVCGAWKVGDMVWIDQPKLDPWYGEIKEFDKNGKKATLISHEEGDTYAKGEDGPEGERRVYSAAVEYFRTEKPVREAPKPVEEKKEEKKDETKAAGKKTPPVKKAPPVRAAAAAK